jgi:hypothetical protein
MNKYQAYLSKKRRFQLKKCHLFFIFQKKNVQNIHKSKTIYTFDWL